MAEHFIGEFFGTMMLLILGCGVVANVVLHQSKGQHGGWIVITFGWAMGVFVGVYTAVHLGGSGHLNPAVTIALALFKVFCTAPSIRNLKYNLLTETIGTFILLFRALSLSPPSDTLGTLNALPVALLVLGIGLSLGGPTGYAINPARDLGPRIAHFLLPIKTKGHSDWSYAWIPVAGPVIGASMAVLIYNML